MTSCAAETGAELLHQKVTFYEITRRTKRRGTTGVETITIHTG